MKIKTLTIAAFLGTLLAGNSAHAWSNSGPIYHQHDRVEVIEVYVEPIYEKPSTWHTHPENGLTNDTYHSHPNGHNYHEHNYGTGGGHAHGDYTYMVCPYAH